jgi:hypothetical protein
VNADAVNPRYNGPIRGAGMSVIAEGVFTELPQRYAANTGNECRDTERDYTAVVYRFCFVMRTFIATKLF